MSTQSPTPTPKPPRSNRRNQKQNATPSTQHPALLATPPSSPPRNVSPGATDSSNNLNASKKKRVRSTNKKPRDMPKASPAQKNNNQHTSSNPASSATPQVNSPHYAGPTFHASPAPSALPMPSFFSKSMPDSDIPPVIESESDNGAGEPDLDATPSKPKSRPQHLKEEPQSSPLDFLFKAAVEARNAQQQRSPERNVQQLRSPQTDSKALYRKSPGPGGIFPFEMEGHESYHSPIGPSFAPSYKDRMNALRSSNASSPQAGDENQRRMQTEAVKNLLLNPRPQRPTSTSNSHNNSSVSLDQRHNGSPNIPHYATPLRTNSGPPTAPSGAPLDQHRARNFYPPHSGSKQARPHNQMFSHDGNPTTAAVSSPHGRYEQSHHSVNHDPQPMYSPARHQSPTIRAVQGSPSAQGLDTKKIEDDLRRILKLDVNPGFPPSSIQSSYA